MQSGGYSPRWTVIFLRQQNRHLLGQDCFLTFEFALQACRVLTSTYPPIRSLSGGMCSLKKFLTRLQRRGRRLNSGNSQQ